MTVIAGDCYCQIGNEEIPSFMLSPQIRYYPGCHSNKDLRDQTQQIASLPTGTYIHQEGAYPAYNT
ncbi:hypothetical protein UXS34_003820 [Salmonella enterica]|nr:hypothetical protein [Salmonella enterica]